MGRGDGRGRRVVRRLLAFVILLVAVFYAGGGWYFSGRIRSDGLDVKAYPVERHLSLTDVTRSSVRIASDDDSESRMVRASTTFGLKYAGGYGRISGPVVSRDAGHVVRRFEVVKGSPPKAGAEAELDLVAFPDDPTYALGPRVRTVTYASPGGRFPAWYVRGDPRTWTVVVHGKGGSRMEMFRMARSLEQSGLSVLDITYRNDEGLADDPSRHYGYGRTEWRDLRAAVSYAAAHGATKVVLGADSMGGGIVASYLRHRGSSAAGPKVVGLVLDAPMLDFGRTVSFGAEQIHLPLIGPVPGSLTAVAKKIAAVRYGLDWSSVNYLSDTSWVTMPVLLFHGTADTTVPISTSRELRRDEPGSVTLVTVPGAEHVRSWNADPAAYDARVARFVAPLVR